MSEFWEGFKDMFSEFVPNNLDNIKRNVGEICGILAGASAWIVIAFILIAIVGYLLR